MCDIGLLFVMIFGLSGRVLAKDTDTKGRYSSPVLDITEKQLILEKNQTLQLNCMGRWELQWIMPSSIPKVFHGTQIEESQCGKKNNQYCSRLTLSPTLAQHTGSYRCRYHQKQRKQASVYIYITDNQRPFVKLQSKSPDVVYMKERKPLIFPCRVTNPKAKVSLVKFPDHQLEPDHRNIIWNSRQGFIIRSPTYFYIGLFFCETIVNGVKYTNNFLTHRPVNKILSVYLNSTDLVHTLQGEMLALNCTVTAEWNSRVSISWAYPGKANGSATISRHISRSRTNMLFYSVLTIPRLSKADRGLYKCHVTSGPSKRETNTTVIVYDQPFIRLKNRDGPVVQAFAGQKSFRLAPKLRAFPAPEITWFKDDMVAAERCSRYHVDGFSLVIRDVAEEDAGIYTILTGIQQYGLFQNLTITLVVNVKPQIGEKTVSSMQPRTVQRGSRQALHCTSHGVPPPQIQWLWHPCPPKGLCEKPSPSSWTIVSERTEVTSTHNPILNISYRQEVLQGKDKTVGVLTVAEALISGIYRCVASNLMGRDELDILFYVTDVKGGFIASLEEEPREGGDLRLVCMANKHLYSDMLWYKMTHHTTASEGNSVLGGELTEGEFSLTLHLLLKNVTSQDSGTYICDAKHLLTRERTHLDIPVEVTDLQAPVLLQKLSDHSVNVSNSVTLHCPTQGVPHPDITWYKDQRKLHQVSGIMLFPEEGTLHIDRITSDDEGIYTCKATNERGSVESSAHIWVHSSSDSLSLEIPTLACTCVVATLFWLLLTLLIRKLKQPNINGRAEYMPIILHPGEEHLVEHCHRLQYDAAQWEFPRDRLKLEKPLGRGAFGRVMQASAFGIRNSASCTTVAVKMLNDGATPSEHKALMMELKILNYIGHHLNVVNLLGACTKPGGPLMVIVEYCKFGNLSAYLKSKRDVFLLNKQMNRCKGRLPSVSSSQSSASSGFSEERGESSEEDTGSLLEPNSPLLLEDLISYSFQVARGMEFLFSRKCIHRDLAARNILLTNNNVVKICDFGLARDVFKNPDYVRKGDARLPLKWMAPESIFDKVFTTQSDVWSYGVLLWEIFSLGASPYPGLSIDEEFCHRLKQGTRMCPPEYSTPEIYSIMRACWENNPEDRPSFTTLVEILGDHLQTCVQQDGKEYIPLNTLLSGESNNSKKTLGTSSYINTGQIKAISTFEEDLHKEIHNDNQSDSGMVLPSEELFQVKWMNSFKTKAITKLFTKDQNQCGMLPCMNIAPIRKIQQVDVSNAFPHICYSESCCSHPPDYEAALLYPLFLAHPHQPT
ncbi:vascular endothelial growth factor receptor 1-like isoform X4 [Xyrauchen texanus]|uniref:vascular endothelial growth factor receptor 1-like isoform X1 n=1 Tax=Xyrauchen texanus TaxID=154827 RepID=UPI0022427CF0|nr:vascular endothelial growth factor receptor 1-like isoform X1 [Xyrauchen texanus]XP_051970461.1 vascular endothelial growth factor receptor 1-like isoform X2 [Xyrauchen texanus]XP_051970463.1 vascular endothelial growth factor receptor 1-like isoform X3 [Xyrauchen texanus]XP_051970464.1 vascular endothelial growth factor receptor 1-like isoform X4 [Xyrauchen texanus]